MVPALTTVALALVMLLPIAWMFSSSFKSATELFLNPPVWVPSRPTLESYTDVLGNGAVQQYAINSVVVTGAVTAIGTIVAVLAGYGLSRFVRRGHRIILLALLATQVFPQTMMLIPLFRMWAGLGLLNSYASLILSQLALLLPLAIWLMTSYFDRMPATIEEAARVDGAGRMTTLIHVVLPVSVPGVIVVALFVCLGSWDEYLFTSTLATSDAARTLTVGIVNQYIGLYAYSWGPVMAFSAIISIPMIVLFLAAQGFIVSGLLGGSER